MDIHTSKNRPSSLVVRFVRSYVKALVGLMMFAVVLLVLFWGVLQLPFVKNLLSDRLSGLLSSDAVAVKVEGIHGLLPFTIAIDVIEVSDTSGPCLKIKAIKGRLAGWLLLQKTVHLYSLHAEHLWFGRLPKAEPSSKTMSFSAIPWSFIPAVELDRFDLAEGCFQFGTNRLQCSMQGDGSFHVGRGGLEMNLRMQGDIQGTYALHGSISPVFSGMKLSLSMESEQMAVLDYSLDAQTGSLQLSIRDEQLDGRYSLDLERQQYEVISSGTFHKSAEAWKIPWIEIRGPGVFVGGSLARAQPSAAVQGDIKGVFDNLSYIGEMWNLDINGRGEVQVILNGDNGQQYADIALDCADLKYKAYAAAGMRGSLVLRKIFAERTLDTRIEVRDFVKDDVQVDYFKLTSQGDMSNQVFSLQSTGDVRNNYILQMDGTVSLQDGVRVEVASCNGAYGDTRMALMQPSSVQYKNHAIQLNLIGISLGTGVVYCAGMIDEEDVFLDLSISNLPLNSILFVNRWVSEGEANGHINLNGKTEAPRVDAQVLFEQVKARNPILAEFPPVRIKGVVHIDTNHVNGLFTLDGDFVGVAESKLDMPCTFRLVPTPVFKVPTNADVNLLLNSTLQLNLLNRLPMADDMKFEGSASLSLYHQGPVNGGNTTGAFALANGSFRYFPLGTYITNITIKATADGRHLVLTDARATDLNKGYLTATGHVALIPAEQFPYSIHMMINDFHAVKRKDLSLMTSGKIAVEGTRQKLSVVGKAKIDEGLLRLEEIQSAEGVKKRSIYDSIEVADAGRADKGHSSRFPVDIDVEIVTPGTVSVRGRGLDSLWKGELRISQKNQHLWLNGYMDTVRGSYKFLGRLFTLAEGEIRFDGVIPPDPILDIHALYKRTDITADLGVMGRVSDPELVLSSTPVMPEDEIISQILFGKSMSTITPLQAITVAGAVADMHGKGNTFSFMDKTREILGVDQLEFQESGSEKGETELVAGKYVADGLYLEVHTALGSSEGSRVSAEYELTPHLTIETDAGANMRPGIGFNWKRDY